MEDRSLTPSLLYWRGYLRQQEVSIGMGHKTRGKNLTDSKPTLLPTTLIPAKTTEDDLRPSSTEAVIDHARRLTRHLHITLHESRPGNDIKVLYS